MAASMETTLARLVFMLRVIAISAGTAAGRASGPGPASPRTTRGHLSTVRDQRSRRALTRTNNFLPFPLRLPDRHLGDSLRTPAVSRASPRRKRTRRTRSNDTAAELSSPSTASRTPVEVDAAAPSCLRLPPARTIHILRSTDDRHRRHHIPLGSRTILIHQYHQSLPKRSSARLTRRQQPTAALPTGCPKKRNVNS